MTHEELLDLLISEDGLDFSACSETAFARALELLEQFDIAPREAIRVGSLTLE